MGLHRTFILRGQVPHDGLLAFLAANWRAMADAGKPLAVTVSAYKAKRNADQNARYWAMIGEIAAAAWVDGRQFSAEVWHEHFKRTFLGVDDLPAGATMARSSAAISVAEFAEYMSRVEAHAAQALGVEFTAHI